MHRNTVIIISCTGSNFEAVSVVNWSRRFANMGDCVAMRPFGPWPPDMDVAQLMDAILLPTYRDDPEMLAYGPRVAAVMRASFVQDVDDLMAATDVAVDDIFRRAAGEKAPGLQYLVLKRLGTAGQPHVPPAAKCLPAMSAASRSFDGRVGRSSKPPHFTGWRTARA